MKKVIFAVALVALASLALAQDIKTVPAAIGQKVIAPAIAGRGPIMASDWVVKDAVPPFCKAKCLYYAGDFNSADSSANGLFNANYSAAGLVGQTWPGVKPPAAATIHGATFNEFEPSGSTVTNPTPFQTEIKVVSGSGGKVVCNTSGTATNTVYGMADFGLTQYSIYIKKLKKACKIQAGKTGATYVNLLPTISAGNAYAYTVNVEDAKPAHHIGWKNDLDDCWFNGPAFGVTWQACNTQGTFDELSFALNK